MPSARQFHAITLRAVDKMPSALTAAARPRRLPRRPHQRPRRPGHPHPRQHLPLRRPPPILDSPPR
jgi:hypothetical protein